MCDAVLMQINEACQYLFEHLLDSIRNHPVMLILDYF
jgi:hypothetical protein